MLMSSLLAVSLLAPSNASRQTLTWSRNCPATLMQKASDKRQGPGSHVASTWNLRSLWRIKTTAPDRYRPRLRVKQLGLPHPGSL